jgi:transcriptional regulator with AAA-type ATPase domain
MKLDQLRKIIREEVRAAVKEELQEVMNEAVKYASTPTKMQEVPKGQPKKWSVGKSATLDEMLNATRAEMTGQEYNDIVGGSGVQKPNFASMMSNQMVRESNGPMPGIDISKLDFVGKAKAIFDKSIEKSKMSL